MINKYYRWGVVGMWCMGVLLAGQAFAENATSATLATNTTTQTLQGKKYTCQQLKLENGDGITINEEKNLMGDINLNPKQTQIQLYGQPNPFKDSYRQKGVFNGTPFIVVFGELKDAMQVDVVRQAMDKDFESRKQTLSPAFYPIRKTYGNMIITIYPKDNQEFVKLVLEKISKKL